MKMRLLFVFGLLILFTSAFPQAPEEEKEVIEEVVVEVERVTPDPTKTWPELVGKTGEEARDAILAEYPTLEIEIIPVGWPLSIDFRPNRVRILLCERGLVQNPPYIG